MIQILTTEDNRAEALLVNSVLSQMPEFELARLLDMVEVLELDFQHVPLRDGETIQSVESAQNFLKIWNDEAEHILRAIQVKDTCGWLHNWDNEGGKLDFAFTSL